MDLTRKIVGSRSWLALAGMCLASGCQGTSDAGLQEEADAQVGQIANAPVRLGLGSRGISYTDEDSLPWGPTALAADMDGTLWIADGAAARLVHVSILGEYLGAIDLHEHVIAAHAIEVDGDDLVILDKSANTPRVVRVSRDGSLRASADLHESQRLDARGLVHTSQGLALDLGAGRLSVLEGVIAKDLAATSLLRAAGRVVKLSAQPLLSSDSPSKVVTLSLGDRKVDIHANGILGSVSVEHTFEDGSVLVLVEDVGLDQATTVDQTLWHINAHGDVIGKARVPTAGAYTSPVDAITVTPDGDVFAMRPRADGLELHHLEFHPELASLIAQVDTAALLASLSQPSKKAACTLARTKVISNALAYVNNVVTLTKANVSGVCAGREKPRNLKTASVATDGLLVGTYHSVPYDWGGFDSIAAFNQNMKNGMQAGDINRVASTVETCSRGVDCSGLVSNALELTGHWGTGQLPELSAPLKSFADLKRGDLLLRFNAVDTAGKKLSDHVMIFDAWTNTSTIRVYEATTALGYDRVVTRDVKAADLPGYKARHATKVCL